jgi:hypothetical protein
MKQPPPQSGPPEFYYEQTPEQVRQGEALQSIRTRCLLLFLLALCLKARWDVSGRLAGAEGADRCSKEGRR